MNVYQLDRGKLIRKRQEELGKGIAQIDGLISLSEVNISGDYEKWSVYLNGESKHYGEFLSLLEKLKHAAIDDFESLQVEFENL